MIRFGLPFTVAVIGLDQATKYWVQAYFGADGATRHVDVTSFFMLVLAWNRGVSFSFLNGLGPWIVWVLTALALGVSGALITWMARARNRWAACGLGLIAGGALGNAIDRVRFGAVTDFLYFHLGDWYFPAFNVADSAITVGAVVIMIESLLNQRAAAYKEGP
jgi:signal peptidase II